MRWLLLICVAAFASCSTRPSELKNFQSDGCSAFPDGTLSDPQRWQAHCVKHDFSYWQGGTREQRREADRELVRGVRAEGHPVLARCMYFGIRIGGAPWWPTPWRWGFGWSYPRGYGLLSSDEERQVNERGLSITGDELVMKKPSRGRGR
jgi:hypothetical protein